MVWMSVRLARFLRVVAVSGVIVFMAIRFVLMCSCLEMHSYFPAVITCMFFLVSSFMVSIPVVLRVR
jgi:hypothetical protein